MKTRISVSAKLTGTFAIISVFALLMGWACVQAIVSLSAEVTFASDVIGRKALLCGQLQGYSGKMRGAVRGAILYSTKDMHKPDVAARSLREFLEFSAAVKAISTQLDTLNATSAEREAAVRVRSAVDAWQPVVTEIASLTGQGQFGDKLTAITMRSLRLADELDAATGILVKAQTAGFAASALRSAGVSSNARAVAIPLIAITIGMCLAGYWITRGINQVLQQVAKSILSGSEQIRDAAEQVSSAAQTLAQSTSEQAASLEQTSASSEEVNSMARKNTQNSRTAAEVVAHSAQMFTQTSQSLDDMVRAINEINESSGKISKIIKVIDEIAFQTNILALNAAVEAARAGEAGLGFAVVAEEVRALAQRCTRAAKETATLIEDSIGKSSSGKDKVDQMAAAIHAVAAEAATVKLLVDEVHQSSAEQATGIEQISKSVMEMEQVTQTTAATAEESAAAAEQLNAQSEAMRAIAGKLNTLLGGGRLESANRTAVSLYEN